MANKRVPLSMSTPGHPLAQPPSAGAGAVKESPVSGVVGPRMVTATLPSDIQQHLGNLLRASYNDVLTAPVPERFLQLLQQLEEQGSRSSGEDEGEGPADESRS